MYRQFYRVFELFKIEEKPSESKNVVSVENKSIPEKKMMDSILDDDDDEDLEDVSLTLHNLSMFSV